MKPENWVNCSGLDSIIIMIIIVHPMNIYQALLPCQVPLKRVRPPMDEPFEAPCFANASGKSTGGTGAPLENVVVGVETQST